jgi:putative nucleotidyltransferase with HDIG domain
MTEKLADTTAAQRVELAVYQLESLSTLPPVAARFFPKLMQPQFSAAELAEIIESDAALAVKIISLMNQQRLIASGGKFSIRQALDKLPAHLVRNAILSVKVSGDTDSGPDNYRALPRKQLAIHNLAVACCAKDIAETMSPKADSELAYTAGLLHDIGKLALDQAMPKSFTRIISDAKTQNASSLSVEQKQLNTDHTILGKRLAQKWHLPEQFTLAIWLHHSDTTAIAQSMPEAKIAQIVQLADLVARQCGIGQSGSYDKPTLPDLLAKSLAISAEQLKQIRRNLTEQVAQKTKVLGLDLPAVAAVYGDAVHSAVSQLAEDNTKLSLENRRLQMDSGHFDFMKEFLAGVDSAVSPVYVAEKFAAQWQKFYQTGKVCLYLAPSPDSQILEAVVVENLSQSRIVYLNAPTDTAPIPKEIQNDFAILDAYGHTDWLFEQLDIDFDIDHAKLIPLLSRGKTLGAIVFELRYPGDAELFERNFKTATSIAGAVLDLVFASADRQRFAEQFVQLISRPVQQPEIQPQEAPLLDAMSEMAAGAAHELNNPLSVISGRTQLLTKSETDSEKKQILRQIQENTSEISAIIDDMMSFAQPAQPRPTQTNVRQLLDEAVQLTSQKTKVENIDVQMAIDDSVENVLVDSGQIVSAIANVLSNSIESYGGNIGPIKVTVNTDGSFVRLQITDAGCGMDAETLQKATQPFFSAKPAGRKRGMGLAHAQRFVQLNKGSLDITSEPGKGTTVTILLPF